MVKDRPASRNSSSSKQQRCRARKGFAFQMYETEIVVWFQRLAERRSIAREHLANSI
jgi:hypothetical protein